CARRQSSWTDSSRRREQTRVEGPRMPLVVVPTPLGNLRDVTLRALDVLREADAIVAEDTRVARRLLAGLGIPGRTIIGYREQNAAAITERILSAARS